MHIAVGFWQLAAGLIVLTIWC